MSATLLARWLLLLAFLWAPGALRAAPVTPLVTEFMANNEGSLLDEDDTPSDWVELHNPTASTINLQNWCLTDDPRDLTRWRFPATPLAPGEFLLVWASGKDRRTSGSPLHTNFSLSKKGGFLALVKPDGVTIAHQYAAYPPLLANESFGLPFLRTTAIAPNAPLRYRVPDNDNLGLLWTARTFDDSGWTAGNLSIGYGQGVRGITVRHVLAAGGGVYNIDTCLALLAEQPGSPRISKEATVTAQTIDYLGDGADGHYTTNTSFPAGAGEPFAVRATGFIDIPAEGTYTFGLNSDDGGRIRIDGQDVMVDDTNHGPEDHLGTVHLAKGVHSFEVLMWEGGGGDCLEFYAKAGSASSWSSDMRLVGDTAAGGLPAYTGGSIASTDIASLMKDRRTSCQIRTRFDSGSLLAATSLALHIRYDDGFVAYLDGSEVARANAPATPAFNSTATAAHASTAPGQIINLTALLPSLASGAHVLAIHGLNQSAADSTFLIGAELSGGIVQDTAAPLIHLAGSATPGTLNAGATIAGRTAPVTFGTDPGYFTSSFPLSLLCATADAVIRYTTDGTVPTETSGILYTTPVSISKTSILRAAAFKPGYEQSRAVTGTFLFIEGILDQSPSGARPGPLWPQPNPGSPNISYGMDPRIVGNTDPSLGGRARVREGLLSLPALSMVTELPNLFDPSSGILFNPYGHGMAWERPGSLELLLPPSANAPNGSAEFQIDCGLRTRGGYSRDGSNPKHGFHLHFRSQYGSSKLQYPLFGSGAVSEFEQVDLRTSQNYSWAFSGDPNNTFLREEASRLTQLEMGQPASHLRYVHLFINGHYWGLFNFDERTEAAFGASYFGGSKSDYDVPKCTGGSGGYTVEATDGDLAAWQALWEKARAHAASPTNANYFKLMGLAQDGVTPTSDPVLLDVDNLIDYNLLTFWTGNEDGCTSAFLGNNVANNWFSLRNRTSSQGFRFFAHDFEHCLGLPSGNPAVDRTGPFLSGNQDVFAYSNPMFLHQDLMGNAEYRIRWADRVQKHLFNQGALSTTAWLNRINRLTTLVDTAIFAESARWGRSKSASPLNHAHWAAARDWLLQQFLPTRNAIVLDQLRADQLYPSIDAPTLSPPGGTAEPGTQVLFTGPSTIYAMPDGSDPRAIGGAVKPDAQAYTNGTSQATLVPTGAVWRYLDDGSNQGTAWRGSAFDDSAWKSGPAELGYGDGDEATTVNGGPTGARFATTYFRRTFSVTDASALTALALSLKYDDQAWVYLNGQLALRTDSTLPANPAYDFYPGSGTANESSFFDFTLDPALLVEGTNIIAVEIHQMNAASTDISFDLSLRSTKTITATPFLLQQTPGEQVIRIRGYDAATQTWSALSEASFLVGLQAPAAANLAITEIMYRPAAPLPEEAAAGFTARDFEYVVLTNFGAKPVVLTNLRLAGGIQFDFASSLLSESLDPGNSVLVVSNLAAFTLRYGSGLPVAGVFSGHLSNLGDTVELRLGDTLLRQLAYSSTGAWPSLPNDGGYSILRSQPSADTSTDSLPASWTAGTRHGGEFQRPSIPSTIQFSSQRFTVSEGRGSVLLRLVRSGDLGSAASVDFTASNGTAAAGTDYRTGPGTIRWIAGQPTTDLLIALINDSLHEPDEQFTVTLSNSVGANLGLHSSTTVLIQDDDPPTNDRFINAQILSDPSGSVEGENTGATREPTEPEHGGAGQNSIWFRWQAPASGMVTFSTEGSVDTGSDPLDTLLAAYSGSLLPSLAQIATNDDAAPSSKFSKISFPVQAGTSYAIAVDGRNGAIGRILLRWDLNQAGFFHFIQPTYRAREDAGSAFITIMRSGPLTQPCSVDVLLVDRTALAGEDYAPGNTTLQFAAGQRSRTLPITLLPDSLTEGDEELTIALANPGAGAELDTPSTATLVIADTNDDPANNAFATPAALPGPAATVTATNVGADLEPGEPVLGDGASIWFRWTSPVNGRVRFSTAGSTTLASAPLDTLLAAYTGTTLQTLQRLAFNDDDTAGGTPTSAIEFAAVSGVTYRLAIDTRGSTGNVQLQWALTDGTSLLTPNTSLLRPRIQFTESYGETVQGTQATGYGTVATHSLTVSYQASMADVPLATINPSTPYLIRLGTLSFSGTLAEDTAFSSGKSSARITLRSADVAVGSLSLSWTASVLTATLQINAPNLSITAPEHRATSGTFLQTLAASDVAFSFGGSSGSRPLYLSGKTSLQVRKVGGTDFPLAQVQATGDADYDAPRITINGPAADRTPSATAALSGTVTDAHPLASVQLLLNGAPFPTLNLNTTPDGNSATWSAADIALLPGLNTLELRAVDESGNTASRSVTITRATTSPLTLATIGSGKIAGQVNGSLLEPGKTYRWTAIPDRGSLFSHWSGATDATTPAVSIVATPNLLLTAHFVEDLLARASGSYEALVRKVDAQGASMGLLKLTATITGTLSGRLTLGSETLTFSGRLLPDGSFTKTLRRNRGGSVTLHLNADLAGAGQLSGTLTSADFTADVTGLRAAKAPVSLAGTFTARLAPDSALPAAAASGFASVSISTAGTARLAGQLPDGTKLTAGGALSHDGLLAFHVLLSKTSSIGGALLFTQNAASGSLYWTRPSQPAVCIPLSVECHRYTPPKNTRALASLDPVNGQALLSLSSTAATLSRQISLSATNLFSIPPTDPNWSLTLTLNPATGTFQGTFTPPGSTSRHTLSGVLDQTTGTGFGIFLGPTGPGSATLVPQAAD